MQQIMEPLPSARFSGIMATAPVPLFHLLPGCAGAGGARLDFRLVGIGLVGPATTANQRRPPGSTSAPANLVPGPALSLVVAARSLFAPSLFSCFVRVGGWVFVSCVRPPALCLQFAPLDSISSSSSLSLRTSSPSSLQPRRCNFSSSCYFERPTDTSPDPARRRPARRRKHAGSFSFSPCLRPGLLLSSSFYVVIFIQRPFNKPFRYTE